MKNFYNKGFFLVEVVVATGVIAVTLILLLSTIQNSVEISQRSMERSMASYALEEGAEAIKAIRNNSFATYIATLTAGTTYYLSWSSNAWTTTTSPQTVGIFTRTIVMSDVSRDSTTKDIVTSGGTNDVNTKKFTVTVTWTPQGTTTSKSEELSFYISNI